MSDPAQPTHTTEPAEGAPEPGEETGGRTPHPQEPAEGADGQGGADTPAR